MEKFLGLTAILAAIIFTPMAAQAADPVVQENGYTYIHIDGTYVFDGQGGGIQNGFDPAIVREGAGGWVSGYLGYAMPSGWDFRLGGGYAGLGAGKTNGIGTDIYGIDRSRMINVDGDIGYDMGSDGIVFRPCLASAI